MRRLQSVKRAVARFEASPLTHFPAGHRSFAATDMNNIQMPGFSGSSTCSSLSILHDLTLLTNSPSFRDRYSHMAQARPQSGWLDLFLAPRTLSRSMDSMLPSYPSNQPSLQSASTPPTKSIKSCHRSSACRWHQHLNDSTPLLFSLLVSSAPLPWTTRHGPFPRVHVL
jgi:hypothetical protein